MKKKLTTLLGLLVLIAGLQFIMAPNSSLIGQTYRILVKQGLRANLPTLATGEFGFSTDTKELHIGSAAGNLRIMGDYVTPEMYGAKGDGVTDDTAAIQAAINAANIAGGGTVQFSRGPYGIASGLTLYGNIRYHGHGHGMASGGYFTKGTTISWLGGTSGTMVTANDTWGVMWDGISLKGNLSTVPSSTVVGISVNSTNPSNNSQRNYFRNFSIYGCDYAMGFDKDYPTATNTDGWVVENFLIYDCNVGVYTDSQNVAYATIRNGAIGVHDVGIYLNRSGFLKIESIAFGGHDPKGAIGAMIYAPQSYVVGVLLIEQCQSEGGAGFNFMDFRGGTINRGYPMTLLSNNIDQPVVMNNGQDCLVSIGNLYHENMTINGNDSHVYSLADVFSGIGIVDAGISNSIMTINSSGGIGTPSLDIPHDIECGGDINVPTGKAYTINGTTVVNQDVSNMSDPRFESINVLGTEETLIDGAFENWVSATDLTSWVEVTTGTTTINRESSVIHGGTFACRFDVDSSNNDAYLFQDVTWLANYPYTLSIWHKTPSVNAAWIVIQDLVNDVFLQPDGTWGVTFAGLIFPASPSGYSKLSFGFNSNSGTSYRITIQRGIATSLSLYFDDFSISKMLVFGGVNTYVDQPVKTTSTPSFSGLNIVGGIGTTKLFSYQADNLADDGTVTLPDATSGMVLVSCNGEAGMWLVQADGAVTKISGSTNTAAADTDANLCVYDSGTGATVKNRLGATGEIRIVYYYN